MKKKKLKKLKKKLRYRNPLVGCEVIVYVKVGEHQAGELLLDDGRRVHVMKKDRFQRKYLCVIKHTNVSRVTELLPAMKPPSPAPTPVVREA